MVVALALVAFVLLVMFLALASESEEAASPEGEPGESAAKTAEQVDSRSVALADQGDFVRRSSSDV